MAEDIRVDADGYLIRDDEGDVGVKMRPPSPERLALIERARATGDYSLLGGPEDAADQDRPQQGDYRPEHRQGIEKLTPERKTPDQPDPFRERRMPPKYGVKRHERPVVRIVDGEPRVVYEPYEPKPPARPRQGIGIQIVATSLADEQSLVN
jgi:hypothetical protein